MQRSARPLLVAFLAVLTLAPAASATRLPGAPRCPVFPRDNAWNQRVDRLAVAPDSARIIASIGLDGGVHDATTGRISPETFPHGTAEQRAVWSKRGFEDGDASACDTFSGDI